jgi:hypothetical protein
MTTDSDQDPSQAPVKYCPECDGEFVPTLDTCPDCGVALVTTPREHPEPVEVFSTTDRALLPLARATLSDAGIQHEEIDRDLSSAIMGETAHETVIFVSRADAERATALLDQMDEGTPEMPY